MLPRSFKDTLRRENGVYSAGLIYKENAGPLPDNYSQALVRLCNLERQLARNGQAEAYESLMMDYLMRGDVEHVDMNAPTTPGRVFYFPHSVVKKEDGDGSIKLQNCVRRLGYFQRPQRREVAKLEQPFAQRSEQKYRPGQASAGF